MPPEQRLPGRALVDDLRSTVERSLREVLEPQSPVALVNFPNHGNPGDPAIWLGTRRVLRTLGCRVAYSSSWAGFDRSALERALPDGPVLINGGGNFGDLYAGQQGLRERLLDELRDRRLVQLPQSIHFREQANLDRVRRLVADHGNVVLMMREKQSQSIAEQFFDASVVLCPDMAFGLGPLPRATPAEVDLLWLHRRPGDPEHVEHGEAPLVGSVRDVEWMEGIAQAQQSWDLGGRWALRVNERLTRKMAEPDPPSWAWRPLSWTYEPLARRWVRHGLHVLSQGRVVMTDKLHGHILSLLMGLPHVVLDNSYGKVRATFETWTSTASEVRWADDADEAVAAAASLLAELS